MSIEDYERLPKPDQIRIKWEQDDTGEQRLSVKCRLAGKWYTASSTESISNRPASMIIDHLAVACALNYAPKDVPEPDTRLLTILDLPAPLDTLLQENNRSEL